MRAEEPPMPDLSTHFPSATAAAAVALWLCGCAASGPAPTDPPQATSPSPSPSPIAQGDASRARYPADLEACRSAASQAGVVQDTLDGMVEGALVAAALVWGLGRSSDAVQDWAIGGALLGGGQQALRSEERRRRWIVACMAERGHGQGAQALALQPPAPLPPPRPFAPPRATGVDTFNAERLAREQSCSAQPLATLAAKGPGFETYSVPCANGDALAVRCEFGNCRVLR
ncbi:hypothetical protein Acidovoranil_10130 [Acidovorax sp. FG27]